MKNGQQEPNRAEGKYFVWPLVKNPTSAASLVNERNGVVVADRLLTAFDSTSRRTGLLHRDSLPRGSALIIAPSNAIHTFFMRFAIDVAFAARDGRVLKIRHAVRPWRLAAALGAFAVIEMPAGTLARTDTRAGDVLRVAAHVCVAETASGGEFI